MKRAVIYYSLSKNTKEAAERIAEKLDADIFEIETEKPMPTSFSQQIMLGGFQSSLGLAPKIKKLSIDIDSYDEIILGMPVWAGKPAAPINTLLKNRQIADKVTAVFTLSGGGDNGKCIPALAKKLKNMKCTAALADRKLEGAKLNSEKTETFVQKIIA